MTIGISLKHALKTRASYALAAANIGAVHVTSLLPNKTRQKTLICGVRCELVVHFVHHEEAC
jgi:hypothetical protein